jgi:hypothetical protein
MEVAVMSRRSTPERIHVARRAATVERLVSEGQARNQVEALVAQWELLAADRPHDRAYWEAFEAWLATERP